MKGITNTVSEYIDVRNSVRYNRFNQRSIDMNTINATKARSTLYKLIEEVNKTSNPITITNSKGKNAVLISEDDFKSIEETVYLYSKKGLVESILKANKENPKKMNKYDPTKEF